MWAIKSPRSTTGHPERTGFEGRTPEEAALAELGGCDAGETERGPDIGPDGGPLSGWGFRSSLMDLEE